ncbi:MAG: aspartate aminotransferase family protein [Deltaproteobacteria bacterium]
MTNAEAVELGKRALTPSYKQQPIALVRGEGSRVWDADGRRYLDMLGGIATCALGHCHPKVIAAVEAQLRRIWHTSNGVYNEPALLLAQELCRSSFGQRVFLCNSGTEANEAALKVVRRYHFEKGAEGRVEVVCALGSFHGRTLGALAATGQPKYHAGVGPLPAGFSFVPYGDLPALRAAVGPKTAAVMLEAIQGEGGVRVAPRGYLAQVRELCDASGALFILDEVQTGMGRTGTLWAYEREKAVPDVMTLAKALGNGLPIGAMIASEAVGRSLTPGTHASTFGGNPVAAAAALAVLRTIHEEGALESCARAGDYLEGRLHELRKRSDGRVVEVRGRGLLWGIELSSEAAPVVSRCRELGMIVNAAGEKVVRFAPSLLIDIPDLDEAVDVLGRALTV